MPEPRTTLADALQAVHAAWEEFKYVLAQALFGSAMARAWVEGWRARAKYGPTMPYKRRQLNPYLTPEQKKETP